MKNTLLLTLVVAGNAVFAGESAKPVTEAEAMRLGWPQLAGPFGTFAAAPITTPLVEDLSQAGLLWKSDCGDFGRGKGDSQAYGGPAAFTAEGFAKMKAPPGNVFREQSARAKAMRQSLARWQKEVNDPLECP